MTPAETDGPWKEIAAVLAGVAGTIGTAYGLWIKQSRDRLTVQKTDGEGSWIKALEQRDRDASEQAQAREREAITAVNLAREQHLQDVQAIADCRAENRELKHRISNLEMELKWVKRLLIDRDPEAARLLRTTDFGEMT